MTLVGLGIIAAAVYAVVRRVDVRLALLLAAVALGILAGNPAAIIQKFFTTLTAPEFVIPICSAMGFAYVLRHTLCDQHLVHLLVRPFRRARAVLIPGAVLVGFVVNIPIISQTSAAVAIGSVLIPLLLAARLSPITAGACLLLGASIGGELLNQGAPEYRTVSQGMVSLGLPPPSGSSMVRMTLPLDLLNLAVATLTFWVVSLRAEARAARDREKMEELEAAEPEPSFFKVNLFKAAVPMVPLFLLFIMAEPFRLITVPQEWLVGAKESAMVLQKAAAPLGEPRFANAAQEAFNSRLIGAAMLVGVAVAACTDRHRVLGVAGAFFEGAGYALAQIVGIIVAASCFGEGVKLIGLDRVVGSLIAAMPGILLPAAGFLPVAFGAISGSGMATTQSLYGFFARPALELGVHPEFVGSLVSLGAAAGRTMSPVAAVALMSASLTGTTPTDLVKRVAGPLLLGMIAVVLTSMALAAAGRVRAPAAPPAPPAAVRPGAPDQTYFSPRTTCTSVTWAITA